ncbi:MAG: hypothetical protein GY754_22240 [bacterium]|nr:hypothetical protein [bacterium]
MSRENNIFTQFESAAFGEIILSPEKEEFYKEINAQIPNMCNSLPESMRMDAFTFMMEYAALTLKDKLIFFRGFYVPTWSVLFWLLKSTSIKRDLSPEEYSDAVCCHAMTMFLHSLDDHLNDADMPATHLLLFMRSQAWYLLQTGIDRYSQDIPGGRELADSLINTYYPAIINFNKLESLDAYCDLFRDQISTWYITPMLTAIKLIGSTEAAHTIRSAFGSFGVAWRIIDDINDIKKDMNNKHFTTVYYALSHDGKKTWEELGGFLDSPIKNEKDLLRDLAALLEREKTLDLLMNRIHAELDDAARIAEENGMSELAREYLTLNPNCKN